MPNSFSPVESSSGNWIKFKVLVKGSSCLGRIGESFLFVIDSKVVEKWNHQDVNSEWCSSNIQLWGVVSSNKGYSEDDGGEHVVCTD